MSRREAAETYGIPRSTLGDKLSGKSKEGVTNRGGVPVVTKVVEDRLVMYMFMVDFNNL